jgi:hypothetical protein
MNWWAEWLVDNPRDLAGCPGLTITATRVTPASLSDIVISPSYNQAKLSVARCTDSDTTLWLSTIQGL